MGPESDRTPVETRPISSGRWGPALVDGTRGPPALRRYALVPMLASAACTQAAVDPGGLGARAAPQLIEVGVPTVLSNLLLGSPETFVAPRV